LIDGYLLDTNHVRYWFDNSAGVLARIATLPKETPLRVSAITLGEIEYGHKAESPSAPTEIQLKFSLFVRSKLPAVLPVTTSTTTYYGDIRSKLFTRFSPKQKQKRRRPEQLLDPVTGKELGIQENDVWIAAQALEHDLILVTNDPMHRIREVVLDLRVENWQ